MPEWAQRLGLPESVVISGGAFDCCHMGAVGAGHSLTHWVKLSVLPPATFLIADKQSWRAAVKGICGQVDGSVVPGFIGLEAGHRRLGISTHRSVAYWLAAGTACRPASGTERANQRQPEQLLPALTEAWAKIRLWITCRWCSTGLTAAAHRTPRPEPIRYRRSLLLRRTV